MADLLLGCIIDWELVYSTQRWGISVLNLGILKTLSVVELLQLFSI
jgi:hypothetical protein